jgi:hypothetical protein
VVKQEGEVFQLSTIHQLIDSPSFRSPRIVAQQRRKRRPLLLHSSS